MEKGEQINKPDVIEARGKSVKELFANAKDDVEDVLAQLRREKRFDEYKALRKAIQDTDPEEAELIVKMLDTGTMALTVVCSIVVFTLTKVTLNRFFKVEHSN